VTLSTNITLCWTWTRTKPLIQKNGLLGGDLNRTHRGITATSTSLVSYVVFLSYLVPLESYCKRVARMQLTRTRAQSFIIKKFYIRGNGKVPVLN